MNWERWIGRSSLLPSVVEEGGRVVVLAYHSLEDRRVKRFFRDGKFRGDAARDAYGNRLTPFKPLTRKAETASDEEVAANPRARSLRRRPSGRTGASRADGVSRTTEHDAWERRRLTYMNRTTTTRLLLRPGRPSGAAGGGGAGSRPETSWVEGSVSRPAVATGGKRRRGSGSAAASSGADDVLLVLVDSMLLYVGL